MRMIRCSCTVDRVALFMLHAAFLCERLQVVVMRGFGSIYTSCFNHSTSFSSAFPRCEILFFSALGISAYVWSSYSKQASQPVTY